MLMGRVVRLSHAIDTTSTGANMADKGPASLPSRAGKYLTFMLGKEVYGLEILKVQEIIGMIPPTRVPGTPQFVRGIINLRGKVIPVIDLRLKFGLESVPDTQKTCIVVVQVGYQDRRVTMGIIVDEVSEVLRIGEDQIEPPPSFGARVDTEFLLGIGKVGEKVVLLLDTDTVLSLKEASLETESCQGRV
jgi:purine-binding chemotaxis protein CheW